MLDAKTQEDLTRSILLQIILEEETGGVPLFSTTSLAQIISLSMAMPRKARWGGLLEKMGLCGHATAFTQQGGVPFTPDAWSGLMSGMTEQSAGSDEPVARAVQDLPFGKK